MAKVTMKLTGFDEAIRQIGAFQTEKRQAVERVLDTTALQIESSAKKNAPVDTGRLRSSIVRQNTGPLSRTVSTNANYAIFVEFGTKFQRAQPFLFPAAEQHRQAFIENLKRALQP